MAKSRKQEESDLAQERSIATFQTTVDNFSKVAEKLADSFAGFAKTQELDRKNKQKQNKEKKVESAEKKAVTKAVDGMNDIFGKKTMSIAGKLMGKANFDSFKKGLGGVKGAGGTGGMLGKAAAGLGSAGGMLLRAAGPAGAVISGLKMAYDFWNSGGLAKLVAGIKMATNKGSMMGPGGVAEMQKSLEGTEEFRKIDAKYTYQKPLELKQNLTKDYFDWEKGTEMDMLQYQQSIVKDEIEYELGLRKDKLQFMLDQQKETLDAELEKRKAISASGISFIEKYATISERALKAIGSGTKQILEGVGKFTSVFGLGIKQSFQLSENAQGLAYHLSGSDEDVMNMTKLFSLMGKTSAETAQNLIAGFESFAKINDIAPQVIFNQIKEAGEDIYKFSNGTADSFAKQAVLLSKMSVSMSSMMKASDTMVLNYKDSIKAEMSLSAMLGKNVNLSEVRAKLMAGDQAGGAAALKSALGGMDIGAMNPFAKQQLTQATGMDISALMALMQGKEDPKVAGELKAEAAKGKAFADAALAQDIANAGAKLKLEQEQRKKILEFEQRQRLAMMMLEQSQKLDQIKLEAAYRAKWEFEYARDEEKALAAANALVESATNVVASRGTGGSMQDQVLAGYGIDTSSAASSQSAQIMKVLKEQNKISDAQLSKYILDLDTKLSEVDVKDKAAVESAVLSAQQGAFGNEITAYNSKMEAEIKRIERIATEYAAKGGYAPSVMQTTGATAEDIEKVKGLVNLTGGSRKDAKGNIIGRTGIVDAAKIEQLRQTNLLGYKSTVAATNATTDAQLQLSTEVATNGQSTLAKQDEIKLATDAGNAATVHGYSQLFAQALTQEEVDKANATNGVSQLTEAEFASALQIETVSLLGLAAQSLLEIAQNTQGLFEGELNMDGRTITKELLNQSRASYALNGAGRKTIGSFRV